MPADIGRQIVVGLTPSPLRRKRISLHAGSKPRRWAVQRRPKLEELAARLIGRAFDPVCVGGEGEAIPDEDSWVCDQLARKFNGSASLRQRRTPADQNGEKQS